MAFRVADTPLGNFSPPRAATASMSSATSRPTTGMAAARSSSGSSTPLRPARSEAVRVRAGAPASSRIRCGSPRLPVEFGQADMAAARCSDMVGRIASQPRPRNAVLDDVEGFHHHARHAEARFLGALLVPEAGGGSSRRLLDTRFTGIVLHNRGAAEQVVMKVDGHHQRLLVRPADRDGDRIDQRPVDQDALVAGHGLEHAGRA